MEPGKKKFGRMPCLTPRCDTTVRIFRNGKGTLSYCCDECGFAPYVKEDQDAHGAWLQNITQDAAPVAAPAKEEGTPPPAAAPEKKKSSLMPW